LVTGFLFAALSCAASAHAILQPTPGGIPIPTLKASVLDCSDNNVEHCIDQSEGDVALIDVQKDALVAPEVFQPTCTLTFKPIVKGGGDHVTFGWYNLKPDPANAGKFLKPTQEELYGMFLFPVGARTGADLAGQEATLDLAKEMGSGISRQQDARKIRGAALFQEYKKKMGMVQPEATATPSATPAPPERQKIAEQ